MSAKVIAIANQKGGVGKTTSAVNLSVALHLLGYRVLVIDMDYQANCSSSFNLANVRPGIAEVLVGEVAMADAIQHTAEGVDLLPSSFRRSLFSVLCSRLRARNSSLTVFNSSLDACNSSFAVSNSSLVACASSLADRNSSAAASCDSMIDCK